ncbi:hypothetical protein E0L93_00405 [Rubrobacter taiwanensis]|uniref:Sugar kinase n=1 Tax=Rubrobacter taiwanensis TaxID=185139 RepID=A0A4R1BSV6_9ACTN|nr:FGGY-family carbohydrate kinase [Rubrobacter taiwanensis]TCJ20728.1 hypothetical protein E0L93_00405 [Rubrobacter taiwanensis]
MKPARGGEGLYLAVDVGTSGVKAGLFTATGTCRGRRSAALTPRSPRPGLQELDLHRVWDRVVSVVRRVVADPAAGPRVAGISFSVASPTVVLVGEDLRPLSGALTYPDTRARAYLNEVRHRVGEEGFWRLTGNRLTSSLCSAAAMRHLLDEASRPPGRVRVGHLNSYLAGRLTGRWVIDWTNASYTGLVRTGAPHEWSREALEALEVPEEVLPEVVAPWQPVGDLSGEAASELGLSRVPVVAGAADTACSAYGVGCVEDGAVFESSGTSGVLTVCRSEPPQNRLFMNRSHVLAGRWLSHGAMSATGAATRWLREAVFCEEAPARSYAELEAEAGRSEPGAGGVVFLPYLLGERTPVWDPDARGAWVGMSTATGRSDLIRAVFESAGYGIRQIMEIEERHSGSKIDEVLLVGGGARSRFWAQLKADITGRVYRRAEDVESACRGAALLAAVGAGVHDDPWSAVREAGPPAAEKIEPTGETAVREIYDRAYAAYTGLYPALRETFGALTPKTEQGEGQSLI